jgi:hypothetical protein
VLFAEALLQRVQLTGRRESFDGLDVVTVRLDGEHRARLDRVPVHQDCACAAVAGVAAGVGAGQPQPVPDQVGEQQPRLDLGGLLLAVDGERDPADWNVTGGLSGRLGIQRGHLRPPSPLPRR